MLHSLLVNEPFTKGMKSWPQHDPSVREKENEDHAPQVGCRHLSLISKCLLTSTLSMRAVLKPYLQLHHPPYSALFTPYYLTFFCSR